MGLIRKLKEIQMKDPVDGTLQVIGVSMPDPTATSANYRMDAVVTAPGIEPTPIVHHGMCSVSKWPSPGQTLPVTVDRAKPERLVIKWDQIQTGRKQAQDLAQQVAMQMRTGMAPSGFSGDPSALAAAAMAGNIPQQAGPPPVVSAADVLARGTAGVAQVDAVFPTSEPCPKPEHTMVGLVLTVMTPGQQPVMVKNLYAVPNDKLSSAAAGMTLPVKSDLSIPGMVAVDWDAIPVA